MVKVKPGAKVITIVPAQDAYGNIFIVKLGAKVMTIESSLWLYFGVHVPTVLKLLFRKYVNLLSGK